MDEENYWRQKSRISWLRQGDRNTKYFYAATKYRDAKNRITAIEDDNGIVKRGDHEIGHTATTYFTKLFATTRSLSMDYTKVFDGFEPHVTTNMNQELLQEVTEDEIKAAVFNIGADCALGLDGFTGAFFQKIWLNIKDSMIKEVQEFFTQGFLQPAINHTNICLLPKIESPRTISDYQPTALCNESYKIISKIMVGRLNLFLPQIISESQVAFILGRNIMDNVICAHEMTHSLKSRKRWAKSYMVVKMDISKAYTTRKCYIYSI